MRKRKIFNVDPILIFGFILLVLWILAIILVIVLYRTADAYERETAILKEQLEKEKKNVKIIEIEKEVPVIKEVPKYLTKTIVKEVPVYKTIVKEITKCSIPPLEVKIPEIKVSTPAIKINNPFR